MAQADGNKKKKTLNLAGLTALQTALDCKQAHTSFGKLPLSVEKSKPLFSFGTGQRFNSEKIFLSKQLAKQSHIGHGSPGPIYQAQNQQKYKKNPKWRFSTADRLTWDTKPKYDFYQNVGFPDDPIEADHARKEHVLTRKFGTESRFSTALIQKTPGPKYFPYLKPQIKSSQKFTFGFRRNIQGASALSNAYSTPNNVGPANYLPQKCPLTGNKKKFSQWSFPKAPRVPAYNKTTDRNQTYDNASSIGSQNISKRKTSPSAHFGSSTRAGNQRTGHFKDMMSTHEVKINIAHPRF